MVKSKKLSKSSLAVIILSLLLILSMIVGMTAAWFVGSKSDTDSGTGTDVKFGKLGAVTLKVTDATWTDATGAVVKTDTRSYYMPGDTVTGAGLELSYDASAAEATEKKVYYVIAAKLNGASDYSYFKVTEDSKLEAIADNNAVLIDGTKEKVTLNASAGAVKVAGTDIEVTKANASSINNDHQGLGVVYANSVGFSINGGEYELRVIQSTNLNPGQAYEALTTGWDAKGGNTVTLG